MLPATWLQVHNIIALRVRTGGNNVDPEINGVSRHPMRDSRGGRTSMKYVGAGGGREETRVWGVMSLLT